MMTELEYMETQLKIERENEEKLKHYPILQKQLEIALDCLKEFADSDNWRIAINDDFIFCYEPKPKYPWRFAIEALKQIDEIN